MTEDLSSGAAREALDAATASALRRALGALGGALSGVPHGALVALGRELAPGTDLAVDLASARCIGVPVIVLRGARVPAGAGELSSLSRREREVVQLLARGLRNGEIARALRISVGTVKDHVHHALSKTGMASRSELAAAVGREGL